MSFTIVINKKLYFSSSCQLRILLGQLYCPLSFLYILLLAFCSGDILIWPSYSQGYRCITLEPLSELIRDNSTVIPWVILRIILLHTVVHLCLSIWLIKNKNIEFSDTLTTQHKDSTKTKRKQFHHCNFGKCREHDS